MVSIGWGELKEADERSDRRRRRSKKKDSRKDRRGNISLNRFFPVSQFSYESIVSRTRTEADKSVRSETDFSEAFHTDWDKIFL